MGEDGTTLGEFRILFKISSNKYYLGGIIFVWVLFKIVSVI